jgi:hypothetical protein
MRGFTVAHPLPKAYISVNPLPPSLPHSLPPSQRTLVKMVIIMDVDNWLIIKVEVKSVLRIGSAHNNVRTL